MSNHNLFLKAVWPRAPLNNGIGRYIGQLQRITLKFCKNHGSSRGLRDFLENNLIDFAKENPGVVVYVKPRRHRTPVIVAEYLDGQRHWLNVKDFDREIIVKWIELMKTQANDGSQCRLRRMWHTENPSIQGPWTPYTFQDPSVNLIKFPDDKFGAAIKRDVTATEQLIKLYEEQKKLAKINNIDTEKLSLTQ